MRVPPAIRRRAPRALARPARHVVDDVVARGAGAEDAADPGVDQRRAFVIGHDAADDDARHGRARASPSASISLRHDQVVGRERADADRVDVLFGRQLHDGGDRLPRRRVDHVHAGVAQEGRDDAAAAIVAVEPDLGDEDAGRRVETRRLFIAACSRERAAARAVGARSPAIGGRRPADARPASS